MFLVIHKKFFASGNGQFRNQMSSSKTGSDSITRNVSPVEGHSVRVISLLKYELVVIDLGCPIIAILKCILQVSFS